MCQEQKVAPLPPAAALLPSLKIAMVIPNLLGGGAERVALSVSRGLLERGHQVDMIVFDENNDYPKEMPDGIRIIVLETLNTLSIDKTNAHARGSTFNGYMQAAKLLNWQISLLPSLKQIRRAMQLAQYMNLSNPDCIISHMHRATVVAQLASSMSAYTVPVVPVVHNTKTEERITGSRLRNLRREKQYWSVLRHANKVIAVSRAIKEARKYQAGISHSQIEVVHNGVPTDSIDSQSRGRPAHKWLQEPGIPVVLGVGRLVPQKDWPTLMRAFSVLRKRMECRLVILGKGPRRKRLEDLSYQLGIAEDYDNSDFTDNPYQYMRHSSVLGLSSVHEGLPTVLLEALACGCPCVSTDIGGPQEILTDGRYGALVPVGDHEAMADALEQAIRNPPPRDVLRRRAKEFSVERCVSGYERVLAAVVQDATSD